MRKFAVFGVCSLYCISVFSWAAAEPCGVAFSQLDQSRFSQRPNRVPPGSTNLSRCYAISDESNRVDAQRADIQVDLVGSKLRAAWRNPLSDLDLFQGSSAPAEIVIKPTQLDRSSPEIKTYSQPKLKKKRTAANLIYDSFPAGGQEVSWW